MDSTEIFSSFVPTPWKKQVVRFSMPRSDANDSQIEVVVRKCIVEVNVRSHYEIQARCWEAIKPEWD